jgi:hypothetical protein
MRVISRFLFFFGLLVLLKVFAQKQTLRTEGQAIQAPPSLVAVTQNLRGEASPDIPEALRQRVMVGYSKLPLSFEANQGQTDTQVKFFSRGQGYDVYLTPTEAVLSFIAAERKSKGKSGSSVEHRALPEKITTNVLRMRLVGANAAPEISGLEQLKNRSNYFTGSDPSKWQTDVPNYAAIQYKDVYPGVDLIYNGNHGELEYDWVVAPGADPRLISLVLEGVEKTSLDAEGDLLVETGSSEARMRKPVVYQVEESPQELGEARKDREDARPKGVERKHFLDGCYVLKGTHAVAFKVAAYDSGRTLIIDPVLSYSSYLGGSDYD